MAIRVLHLTSTPRGIGGVERLLLDAAGKFDDGRFWVGYCNLFCAEQGEGAFPSALRSRGVPCFHVPGYRWWDLPAIVLGLVRLLRRERVEVLHTHMLHATIVGQVAASLARVPVSIVTRHYLSEGYSGEGIRMLEWRLTRLATHVAAVSRAVRDDLVERVGVRPERVTVIHNGIDLEAFDRDGLAPSPPGAGLRGDGYVIGTVGNLLPYKGHADLLRAMARVIEVRPDARLVIAGEGPERAALERLAADLRISDRVLFAGFQANVASLLGSFDLYVHPSRHESFGIAILEAMAARRAVVATIAGGIPEVVVEGETGILVPLSDPDAMAAAVLQLMHDPVKLRAMGERGRWRVEERFTIESVVESYQDLYTTLVRGTRAPAPSWEHARRAGHGA